jgi:glycosyltransferase involved in cell wall biosynthesis
MDVCVVIPAYNEEQNLERVVCELLGTLRLMEGDHRVLIVDDGSADRTGEIAARLADASAEVSLARHPSNRGLGGVYRTGFDRATGDAVTFWPADGQFDPAILPRFAEELAHRDLVLGYLPNRKRGLAGGLLSLGERILYRLLFGEMPRFQGVFMIRTDVLRTTALTSAGRGWAIVLELIIKVSRAGHRVVSLPTDLRPRMAGESKVNNPRTVASNLAQVLELRRRL